ncbi:TonB-dependent receptor domain-containing protein [Bordetella petrii]|uniref:TonB-dependent receptor domain-containing protein n=1 Tax=Bordetella petrii TaxID=94624 RepID=UPI001E65DDEB|nr:TonB-dependent receptor [Bordetella petrii]MCD0503182.1 TonB-dependent receptor [Bordetella petrii]
MNARRDVAAGCLMMLSAVSAPAWAEDAEAEPGAQRTRPAQAATLSPVVVTATAWERSQEAAPASVTVIDGDALRRQPVLDLADAVRDTVGVGLEDAGLGRRGISIRGMSAEHTLMLVDGQRVNSSASAIAHSDFELGWVPTEAIERVEVVRGPMSSLYGSEALGGVVNVITRRATDDWQGSFSTYAMANEHDLGGNQYKTGFYLGGPIVPGKLGLNVWGEFSRRAPLRDAGNTALTALDERESTFGHVGLTWTPDARQRVDVSVDAGNESQEGYRSNTDAVVYEAGNDVQRRRYSISHTGNWAWGNSQVRLYRSTLDRDAYRSDGGDATGPNIFTDTVLDGRVGFAAGRAHKLTLGAETRRERLEDPSVNQAGVKSLTHYALFAQDEIRLSESWELVLGSRFDRHEDFGWQTSPRAYLLFRPDQAWTFRAGVGEGFKAPTLKQLSPEYESRAAMGGRGIIRGNPDLQPETNRAYELGAAYEQGRWSGGVTLFHNDVKNLIETVRQPTCYEPRRVCLEYENVSKARLRGVELTGGVTLLPSWRLDANYTYLDARDRSTGERLADRSRHRANATLTWAALQQLGTRLRVEYIGAQYRSATESDRPGYTLLHWYVDYDVNPNLSLHAGIENLTDKRLANDDAGVYGRADEGRRYFAGLTARF